MLFDEQTKKAIREKHPATTTSLYSGSIIEGVVKKVTESDSIVNAGFLGIGRFQGSCRLNLN